MLNVINLFIKLENISQNIQNASQNLEKSVKKYDKDILKSSWFYIQKRVLTFDTCILYKKEGLNGSNRGQ